MADIPSSPPLPPPPPFDPPHPNRDPNNLFYIHPNENLFLLLVSPVLDASNYHAWARAMYMYLEMKNKYGYIDGSIKKPDLTASDFSAWKRCNTLVLSWLYHSISPDIVGSILWIDDASVVWQELKNRFSQGDFIRISQITSDLTTVKQGNSTVMAYFTTLKKLSNELFNFRHIPSCTSSSIGLNDNYSSVRFQILLLDPLSPLTKVYSMILQQERQLNIGLLPEPTILAIDSRNSFNKPPNGKPKSTFKPNSGKPQNPRLCTNCKKTNHTVDKCFFLHGFPPGYQTKKIVHNVEFFPHDSTESIHPFTKDQIQGLLALLPSPTSRSTPQDFNTLKRISSAILKNGIYEFVHPISPFNVVANHIPLINVVDTISTVFPLDHV
ncbi:uncharacterized protein [Cicer arietinum]|uniref:uncharacterized protein n=1 Tax=Cicer arietinum TaxID=3827 RepID=UPI003CC55AE9